MENDVFKSKENYIEKIQRLNKIKQELKNENRGGNSDYILTSILSSLIDSKNDDKI